MKAAKPTKNSPSAGQIKKDSPVKLTPSSAAQHKGGSLTVQRPPVVVVLGHVDHGKTTLLDHIRKANVAEGETGGITQHIGAYQIEHNGKLITFLDTPGHEAFSEMRRRGAHVADLAVLVVAADEGVKPQTMEAAKRIEEATLPYVVALNKVDRPNSDVARVKKDLSEHNILIEEWGGSVPAIEVSAKTGQGVPELLDMLLLMWEMEEAAPVDAGNAQGVVIESRMDPRRGAAATILVTRGVLRRGDSVFCGSAVGKIRILENFLGEVVESAAVSTPVLISGLESIPTLGDLCEAAPDVEQARIQAAVFTEKAKADRAARENATVPAQVASSLKILPIILKTDFKGSEEAIVDALKKIESTEVGLKIVESGVGDIAETDVKSAESTGAVIMGFRVDFPRAVEQFARQREVAVQRSDLIYEFIEAVRKELSNLLPAEVVKTPLGKVKLLAIFKREKDGLIIGGRVTNGKMVRGAWCDIVRGGAIVGEGKVRELKSSKEDVSEVKEGQDCGILYVGKGETPKEGDVVEVYERMEKRREL